MFGMIFAFQVLPIIIFIASLFAILYYLGVMQVLVRAMAVVMQRVMGTSGAESMNVAASIFMGQTEAPLTIRPFLAGMTRERTVHRHGERHGACFGRRDGGVRFDRARGDPASADRGDHDRAGDADAGQDADAGDRHSRATAGGVKIEVERPGVNIIDAASRGASDGLQLALNVGAMLIAFIGLIAMVNGILGGMHSTRFFGWLPGTLQAILGRVFAPIAWLLGVKWNDCATVGNLLGTRLILNEFVAYVDLGKIGSTLDPRSFVIATYALVRVRESEFGGDSGGRHRSAGADAQIRSGEAGTESGGRGTMANFMSACIAGMLL